MKSRLIGLAALALLSCGADEPSSGRLPPPDFLKEHGARVASYDHGDPKINSFALAIAEAMKVPYVVQETAYGQKIWVAPRTEAEGTEFQGRLTQFAFVVKACGKPELVTPETPAGAIKSCQPT
jgi:hypothetical protein